MHPLEIRTATEVDVPVILDFIRQLAEYEAMLSEVVATPETLRETLFGPKPYAETLLAYWEARPVGFALFFHTYSTFLSKPGLYLEDLFILPASRSLGIGTALFARLARIAQERGCGRIEWSVLNWNQPAIDFYRQLGAQPHEGWSTYRLQGEALERLARAPSDAE